MGLLIVFFLLSIAFSFLCSVLEAVLLSITPSFVSQKVGENTITGRLIQEYKKDIDRPLSAILTLNTIAHTAGAIGVGAQAGKLFGMHQFALGPLSLSYESIIAALMTLAILILSEIIPKTIGANNWRMLTPFTISTIRFMLWALAPFVWLSNFITRRLSKEKGQSVLSRSDFAVLTQVGTDSGALNKDESNIIKNLLNFEKLTVRDIMTPKTVCFMADGSTTLQDFYDANHPMLFSRIPLYKETRDNITGLVLKADILEHIVAGNGKKPMDSIQRNVEFVHDHTQLPDLFRQLTGKGQHLSVVVDDFGTVRGLVTMEDVIETLLGFEIIDETDSVEDLQEYARREWEKRMERKKTDK
jgi:CBS domain containing-hemolysin-like protein